MQPSYLTVQASQNTDCNQELPRANRQGAVQMTFVRITQMLHLIISLLINGLHKGVLLFAQQPFDIQLICQRVGLVRLPKDLLTQDDNPRPLLVHPAVFTGSLFCPDDDPRQQL